MPGRKNPRHLMSLPESSPGRNFPKLNGCAPLLVSVVGLVVDDQNIGGSDSFISFLDNGLWGI